MVIVNYKTQKIDYFYRSMKVFASVLYCCGRQAGWGKFIPGYVLFEAFHGIS